MSVEANIAETDFMGDRFTFIDCPGSVEFGFEAEPVLAGVDLAVVVADAIEVGQALPSRRAEAALVGRLPGAVLWAWPGATSVEVVCRDLSGLRAALGEGCRAALQRFADARVKGAPFSGELGAELEGASLVGTLATAVGAAAGQLCVDAAIDLGGEAEAIARMSGFDVVR